MQTLGHQAVWTSLEVAKLIAQLLTPIAVAALSIYFTRIAKRFEHLQWRNQRLIEKRIGIYDDLAPDLNDLLCYFTFIGCWKDLSPPEVVKLKRSVDKKVYLAAPLFTPAFYKACMDFIGLCYGTFQGWGQDARLKTPQERRRQAAGSSWQSSWEDCFTQEVTDPKEIRAAYQKIMRVFSDEIGITTELGLQPVGKIPGNIQ
jgi:hypothetical protein